MLLTRNLARITALAGVALIAACAPEIEGRLYLQDIEEVASSGKPVIIPAQLRIPESSEDDCNKGLAELATKLAEITPLSDQGECVDVDNNQFSQFTMDLPIVTAESKLDATYLAQLTLAKVDGPAGSGISLNLGMNRSLKDVQDALGRGEDSGFTMNQSDKEQPKFIFTFENDGRDPVGLMPNFVFVDDEPGLPDAAKPISLDRRNSVKIIFSDVISAYVAKANSFAFATIYLGS
jgi:hypothetical protein